MSAFGHFWARVLAGLYLLALLPDPAGPLSMAARVLGVAFVVFHLFPMPKEDA